MAGEYAGVQIKTDNTIVASKITAGSVIVTSGDVDADTTAGGSVVVAGGDISVGKATGGSLLISQSRIHVDNAEPACGPLAAPTVEVDNGKPATMSPQEALDHRKADRLERYRELQEAARRVLAGDSLSLSSQIRDSASNIRDTLSPTSNNPREPTDEQDNQSASTTNNDRAPDEGRSDDTLSQEPTPLTDVDLSDEELAAVITADVLGLFETSDQYKRDEQILIEAHPELEPILTTATSADEAKELAEKYENITFTDEQLDLMHKDERRVMNQGAEEIEFEDLLY